jgi:hypothetical protein
MSFAHPAFGLYFLLLDYGMPIRLQGIPRNSFYKMESMTGVIVYKAYRHRNQELPLHKKDR